MPTALKLLRASIGLTPDDEGQPQITLGISKDRVKRRPLAAGSFGAVSGHYSVDARAARCTNAAADQPRYGAAVDLSDVAARLRSFAAERDWESSTTPRTSRWPSQPRRVNCEVFQ